MKKITVAAAIITRENQGKTEILATQRGYGDLRGGWEFPGGKYEPGENGKDTIIREIKEEMAADIKVDRFFASVDYTYPTFMIHMDCYICRLVSDFKLLEHDNAKWLDKEHLQDVQWLPADIAVVERLEKEL